MPAFVQDQPLQENWILDSGASKHMTFHREWFHEFRECNDEYVSLGDGSLCQVKGRGIILIKRYNGENWFDGQLDDVLFVPLLDKNLFSVGACVTKNFTVNFKGNSVEIKNKKSARFAGTFSSRAARFARKFERA